MSPFNLVQEIALAKEPRRWLVIVACCLLNKTHGRKVRDVFEQLTTRFPGPDELLAATDAQLLDVLYCIGLYHRRIKMLREMSRDYLDGVPIESMRGAGEYAEASVRIFIDGDLSVETIDPWLTRYLAWAKGDEQNGVQG